MSGNKESKFSPFKCSIDNIIGCNKYICNGHSNGNIINDSNCICFPLFCSVGIIFDVVTCIPFSFYKSYKKLESCSSKRANKVSIAIIQQPTIKIDALPSYQFAISNVNDIYTQNTVQVIIDSPPSYY